MAIEFETKDCTHLSDAELAEMADMGVDGSTHFEAGLLSKQAEAWVLITLAREGGKLKGYAFSTLERIGGTPCVLVGLASIKRSSKRDTALRGLMNELYRRAVLAFPDEDVLVGTRFVDASGYDAFRMLEDIVPRPGHKASGEERAWGRRLAKRFGVENGAYDERAFTSTGDGTFPCVFDYESLHPDTIAADIRAQFDGIDADRGDSLITFGWAMAEDLAKFGD
jgi:hypothetical protein